MAEPVKFEKEEMEQIAAFQNQYVQHQNSLGQIAVQRIQTEQRMGELDAMEDEVRQAFEKTQQDEAAFVKVVNEKYGQGVLNPQTGEFTPNKPTDIEPDTSETT
tara:strand:+ start:1005 stop:1316 length:312 start_codon:yes stop_codon:yes gene_type:complete